MDNHTLESKISRLESSIDDLKSRPTQAVLDKTMQSVIQKLDDRDRIIDLELKNMAKSIKIDIQDVLSKANYDLEKKIESKIKEAIANQKEKVSWGLEILRFSIVAAMFILSLKIIKP
jgi:hypothetical protein